MPSTPRGTGRRPRAAVEPTSRRPCARSWRCPGSSLVRRGSQDAELDQVCESREDPIREEHDVRTLLSRRVDGIVVAGRRTDARVPLAQHLLVPVVYVYAWVRRPGRSSVVQRRGRGRGAAVDDLLEDRTAPHRARDRAARPPLGARARRELPGYMAATRPRAARRPPLVRRLERDLGPPGGPEPGGPPIVTSMPSSAAATRSPAAWLMACARPACACPRTSRWSAWTTGKALAENCRPPLTTIDLNLEAVGRTAGELLLRRHRRPSDRRHARHRSQARGPRVLGTAGTGGGQR